MVRQLAAARRRRRTRTRCSPTMSPPRTTLKPMRPRPRTAGRAVPRVIGRPLEVRAAARATARPSAERGARRRVDLVAVMRLEDLDVVLLAEGSSREFRRAGTAAFTPRLMLRSEHDRQRSRRLLELGALRRRRGRSYRSPARSHARRRPARGVTEAAASVKSMATCASARARCRAIGDRDRQRCDAGQYAGILADRRVAGRRKCAAQAQPAGIAGDQRDDAAAHAPGGAEHGDIERARSGEPHGIAHSPRLVKKRFTPSSQDSSRG